MDNKSTCDETVLRNEVSYVGETSRPFRERVWEHNQNLKNGSPKSFIISHWMDTHSHTMEAPQFEWKVIDAYTDALRRQLGEGLHILESGALNKKLEFNHNLICRMEVTTSNRASDTDLQHELSKPKTSSKRLSKFINERASTTDVINLKLKKIMSKLRTTVPLMYLIADPRVVNLLPQ